MDPACLSVAFCMVSVCNDATSNMKMLLLVFTSSPFMYQDTIAFISPAMENDGYPSGNLPGHKVIFCTLKMHYPVAYPVKK